MPRGVVEGRLSIDVRQWRREGWLENGLFTTRLALNEEFGVRIAVVVGHTGVTVGLRLPTCHGGNRRVVPQYVPLAWTACTLGGRRPWFRCRCDRRAALLYYSSGFFACRHCHGLAYACQAETRRLRWIRKGRKIRMRLGAGFSYAEPIPPKPKGMRWQTYWRLRAAVGGR
jgi:hypothetical protein